MITLNLPKANIVLSRKEGQVFVHCLIRKKSILLTPEEWVRQHIIYFLSVEKKYPLSLMKLEMNLKLNGLLRRPDVVVYNSHGHPVVIVECKASNVKINQQTFEQIAQYNIKLQVPDLMVSNGINHYYCKVNFESKQTTFIKEIPKYENL
jgi:type I site-specific restriction endonuclease